MRPISGKVETGGGSEFLPMTTENRLGRELGKSIQTMWSSAFRNAQVHLNSLIMPLRPGGMSPLAAPPDLDDADREFWFGFVVLVAAAIILGILGMTALSSAAQGHDLWINKERRTNKAGEWCCNSKDCQMVKAEHVQVTPQGYQVTVLLSANLPNRPMQMEVKRFVPHSEAAVSGDQDYWICLRPDGTQRCFFFPPGSS
jgi:hypothetical protein